MTDPRPLLLLIDDDRFFRESTAALLGRNLRVLCAASAEEGLEQLALHDNIDVIISDAMMPGMGPVGLFARLPARLQQRMALITGGISDPRIQAALDDLALPCLLKPFSRRDLINLVSVLLLNTLDDQDAAQAAPARIPRAG